MNRKLAAIMAGDVVAYSRLMAEDESATYAALRAAFDDLIEPAFGRHRGRMFKTTGDGFLAAFESVNDALDAAIEIQDGFAASPLQLRIGINLGDVIEESGDVFGDGVNVAARLEAMAQPGGIYVSGAVVRGADRNRASSFRKIGRRQAKNIPEAIDVYAMVRAPGNEGAVRAWSRRIGSVASRQRFIVGGTTLFLIGAIPLFSVDGMAALVAEFGQRIAIAADLGNADSRPSVAVLPFDNLSGKPDETYFSNGLTEDIITELARNPELQVIARNSSFAVGGEATDIREVGRQLGASYVVEGSARRSGDQLRIVAQLIDARSGAHLWSRSFDRSVNDVFAVQTELTSEIVSHLVSYVRRSEVADSTRRPTGNLQAYDLVLQARDRYKHASDDGVALRDSRALLRRAVEMDPTYAAAHAYLGLTYIVDGNENLTGEGGKADIEIGLSEARQAVQLRPDLAVGYQILSFGLAVNGDYAGSMQAGQRAVDLNPSDPDSLMALAKAQVRFGSYDDAVENAERARRLHPIAPVYYRYVHGQALYASGQLNEADRVLGECLLSAPNDTNCLRIRAAVQVGLERLPEARVTMAHLMAVDPKFSLQAEASSRRFGESTLMESFLSHLQAAGPATSSI